MGRSSEAPGTTALLPAESGIPTGPPSVTRASDRRGALASGRRLCAGAVRLARLAVVLWLASVLTFLLSAFLPGDPAVAILGPDRGPEEYARVNQELGVDEPLVTRYWEWLTSVVHGDLGTSLVPPNLAVTERLGHALPVSIELAVLGMLVALMLSVPLAMLCAHAPGSRLDRLVTAGALGMISMPQFLLGMLLILLFVSELGVLPRFGWVPLGEGGPIEHLRHTVLPVATIAAVEVATFTRLLRADLIQTLASDFIRSARMRGLHPTRIMLRHALRPSSFTLITLAGINLGSLIGSTVVIERVFGLPGVGTLLVDGATTGDLPVVQGVVLVVATAYVLINSGIDLLYRWLDPRIRRPSR